MIKNIINKINKWFEEAEKEIKENPELVSERFVEMERLRYTI